MNELRVAGRGQRLAGGRGIDRRRLELCSQPPERAVQRDLDRVRPDAQHLGDLLRGQVGAEAERDQLAVALVERRDRGGDVGVDAPG